MSLRADHLKHHYSAPDGQDRPVLLSQSWAIRNGEQVLIRGVSGSGKTTLFNIIAGLLSPTSGAIYYGDQSLYALPEAVRDRFRARQIGYVFQNHLLLSSLTTLENVVMPMAFAGILPARQWRDHAHELLARVGLRDFAHHIPRKLSTGQRVRVAVARALANNPRVVLADEPTAALDSESSNTIMDLLTETCRTNDAILIVASHDPALVHRFATTVDLRAGYMEWQWAENAPSPQLTPT